jgi:gamma-glutamyltranspeptidase
MRERPGRRPDSGGRSTVFGTYGVVACEHSSAALTGIRILDDGGNVVDPCVAMAAWMAALAPGKRPLNTIIPSLAARADELWATFGVMGGSMQPQGHVQLLSDLIDYDMSPQEAVDRHRHEGNALLVEGRVPETEVRKLRELGHKVEVGADYMVPAGSAQVIRVLQNGVRAGGSDPRKDGCALAQ